MTLLDDRPVGGEPLVSGAGSGIDPFVQMLLVHAAIDDWQRADFEQLDDEWVAELVVSAERLRTRVESVTATVAAEAQRRRSSLQAKGFLSTKAYLKHHGRLSGPEAHARMQVVRMFDLLPDWKQAAERGDTTLGWIRSG